MATLDFKNLDWRTWQVRKIWKLMHNVIYCTYEHTRGFWCSGVEVSGTPKWVVCTHFMRNDGSLVLSLLSADVSAGRKIAECCISAEQKYTLSEKLSQLQTEIGNRHRNAVWWSQVNGEPDHQTSAIKTQCSSLSELSDAQAITSSSISSNFSRLVVHWTPSLILSVLRDHPWEFLSFATTGN